MSQINYTRVSMPESDALILEVRAGNDAITGLGRLDKSWKVIISSINPNKETVTITWQEFLEISHELQKFIAEENERLIAGDEND